MLASLQIALRLEVLGEDLADGLRSMLSIRSILGSKRIKSSGLLC